MALATLSMLGQKKSAMDKYIDQLMAKMTLEQKIQQLNLVSASAHTGPYATKNLDEKLKDGTGANVFSLMGNIEKAHARHALYEESPLKIPVLNGLDIIHGYRTVFPIPLGLACTWDIPLIEQTARVAAIEATAAGYHWTYSPMVDISRDPRWGRVMEGSGEDPYLGSLIAAAMVKGYQGKNLSDPTSLLACVKHFALYGAVEAGREYNRVSMDRVQMYNEYFPPYKAAVEAGVGSIMPSFNDVEGVPATGNRWLLTDVLRNQWGFRGFTVSDYNAVNELIAHGVAADMADAARQALNAGLDMDMVSENMLATLPQLVKEGKVSEKLIDQACRRILGMKYKLGLFDAPYHGYDPAKYAKVACCEEHLQTALDAAHRSIVLLKNEKPPLTPPAGGEATAPILPLPRDTKMALISPFLNDAGEMFSMWSPQGDEDKAISLLAGFSAVQPNLLSAKGSFLTDNEYYINLTKSQYDENEQPRLIAEAVEKVRQADVAVLVLGESKVMSGESRSLTDISIPRPQMDLLKAVHAEGKPVVLVLLSGRPLVLTEALPYADAIIEAWRPGSAGGRAIADVIFGDYNPSGKLAMTFPRSVGQIPIYYAQKATGRPYDYKKKRHHILEFVTRYLDEDNRPLFPFGHGLSYSDFKYGPITLSDTLLTGEEAKLHAKVTITNQGTYAGEETAQLYIRDLVASVTRPVKELKQFQKVTLQPGESRELTFTLTPDDLKFYTANGDHIWESGKFLLFIGTDSEHLQKTVFCWNK